MEIRRSVRVAARAGLLRPIRPDRYYRAVRALRAWGPSLAGAIGAAAALHGPETAAVDEDRSLTFLELDARTNRIARGLTARGVRRGSTAAIMARNHIGFVEVALALAKLGAHTVYLNTSMAAPQLLDVSERENVILIVHDDEFESLVSGFDDALIAMSTLDDVATGHASAALEPPLRPGREIILTSGTTGTPKGAKRSTAPPASTTIGLFDVIPYRSGETIVVAAPLFHAWGFAHLSIGLALGCPLAVQRRFDPEATLALIAEQRAEVLSAVPLMLRRILELPKTTRARYDTSSLRLVPLSGSAIQPGLAEGFMDAFGDVVYNIYGSTEVGSATVATPADLRSAPGTAGRPPAGTELRIIGADDRQVAIGESGRIFVRSGLLFEGYTNGSNKQVLDGFMSTGDTGHVDATNLLFIDGRDDEMIVSGGENVFPREVEDILAAHDEIVEAAAIGVSDDEFGQRLRAFVVRTPESSLDEDAVRRYVRDHLARFKVPRDVVFLDALPRNPTGKVVKRDLE